MQGEEKKRKMHIIRTRHGIPGLCKACLWAQRCLWAWLRSPALDLRSWGCLLIKQFMTWGTRRPGSDHRAVWTEPDPERWNRGGPPGFFLLQSILGRTWPSLQPAHVIAFDTDASKKRQAVHFLSSKTSSQTKSRHLSICSFRK